MHLLEICADKEQMCDLIKALLRSWRYGEGPEFQIEYKGLQWSASRGSISVGVIRKEI